MSECYASCALRKRLASVSLAQVVAAQFLAGSVVAGSTSDLPHKFRGAPYSMMSLSVGYPNDGWQQRAKRLKPSNYIRIKTGSEETRRHLGGKLGVQTGHGQQTDGCLVIWCVDDLL